MELLPDSEEDHHRVCPIGSGHQAKLTPEPSDKVFCRSIWNQRASTKASPLSPLSGLLRLSQDLEILSSIVVRAEATLL